MSTGAKKEKQTRMDQPRAKIDGSTSRHTANMTPASIGAGGKISPNSDRRGKQGRG